MLSTGAKGLKLHIFNTTEELHHRVKTNISQDFCFGFELSDIRPGINEINVTYMFPMDVASNTLHPLYDLTQRTPNIRSWNNTFMYGTPQFMIYVTDLIAMMLTGKRTAEIELAFFPMKTPEFKELDPIAATQLTMSFPFFYLCVFLLPLYYMVTKLAEERESKAREGMKMMGLKDPTYFVAWFIFFFAIIATMSALLVATASLSVFDKSDKLLIFALSVLYGMTLYGFSFIIVALLPSKKSSATAASLVHLLSYYFAFIYKGYGASSLQKMMVAVIPNCALAFAVEHLFHCELDGSGLTWEFAQMEYQNFSFSSGLAILAFDVVLYAFIGYYLDQVMPREIGLARPWNFLCIRSKKRLLIQKGKKYASKLGEEVHRQEMIKRGNFEQVSETLKRDVEALKVRGLRKVFSNGKQAVDDVHMTMYSGQIFALLGHNGAGKTTTISMLTGLLEPTEGQAEVFGIDCFEDMDQLRNNLGVCPQHNVLFEYLSVREHLELYANFKGVDPDKIRSRVDKMIWEIELTDIQHQMASTLSGGQKRKLSVGIALIGDSKVVMLDEPTSGMDTTTRRRFWEMVKRYKQNRIVILTTHYMDEADILGDRICIMAEGIVQCCGSSLFLKNRFGVGYNLILSKPSQQQCPDFDSAQVDEFITSQIPQAQKLQEVSTEITYQLPQGTQEKFKDFFSKLDKNLTCKLNLLSYGVSITTLEEVFLRIGHGEDNATTKEKIQAQTADLSKLTPREAELTEYSIAEDHQSSFFDQFMQLVKKKLIVALRDRKSFMMDFFFPIVLVVFGLYCSQIELLSQDWPRRWLTAYEFPQGRPAIYNMHNFNQTDGEVQEFIDRTFMEDVGPGKLWSELHPVETNITSHFFEQAAEVDDVIFAMRNETGPQYGQFFIQQADLDARFYSIATYVNASSTAAAMSYCSYALQSVLRDLTDNPKLRVNWGEQPLPFSLKFQTIVNATSGAIAAMAFAVAYMMLTDSIVQSIIKERQTNVKHQIMISGASKLAYWASHYTVDVIMHLVPAVIAVFTAKYFEIDSVDCEYVFAAFCFANPVFIYALSFFFEQDAKASVLIRVFFFAFGGVAPIAIQVLEVVNKRTKEIGDELKIYFIYVPIYNLTFGYLSIVNRELYELLRKMKKHSLQPLDWGCAGESIHMLLEAFAVSFVVLVLFEIGFFKLLGMPILRPAGMYLAQCYKSLQRKKKVKMIKVREATEFEEDEGPTEEEMANFSQKTDNDPLKEELRVLNLKPEDCSIKVSKLDKSYTLNEKAVSNLSFGLEYGECFALLGVTGAGKTSTFKCLTGEETADIGELFMGGNNVKTRAGFEKVRCMMGYCPQFDAIYEGMTVYEHLDFYASMKGVRKDLREELVQKQIKEMDLISFANVQAGTLSGGNKRKLSCAIALIGNPPIVLLDEPSTGVDPQARRFMWTIISNISTLRKKSTVVLTTHSMEEAEALCTKMGIMVAGQFRCFGSSQHIKDKYGKGFEIEVKIKTLSENQLKTIRNKYGLKQETVKEEQIKTILKKTGYEDLETEICEGGLGQELYQVLKRQGRVQTNELISWASIEKNGLELISLLDKKFKESTLVEHYANAFTFKVSRDNYSIGAVFGMMEDFKQKISVQEYQVSQTSLEQIFNVFARQATLFKNQERLTIRKDKKDN